MAQLGGLAGWSQGGGTGMSRLSVAQPCVEHDDARYARTCACDTNTIVPAVSGLHSVNCLQLSLGSCSILRLAEVCMLIRGLHAC